MFFLKNSLFVCMFVFALLFHASVIRGLSYEENNDFVQDAFPAEVNEQIFSIPLDSDELMVVYPQVAAESVHDMKTLLRNKCSKDIPFRNADSVDENDLRSKHLIMIGNISNNKWALDLYKRRYAFADAYFPGSEGVIIHPATSIWNRNRNVIVIGVSRDEDVVKGFTSFVNLIEEGSSDIGIVHHLDSVLTLPKPPSSIQGTLDHVRNNMRTTMAPYWNIANWGLLYYLSGDRKWAEHFRDGMYLCYERGETTGQWVSESWTNLYFNLWKMMYVWELLDDDPFFTMKDRTIIEEVLWGFTTFVRWMPNLDADKAPLLEGRQNHTTFLGLSLYHAHRYYTEKYGLAGLDSMVEKYRRAFDSGQAHSFRPNDDAGNYFYYAPLHLLTYQMAEGDISFLSSGRLRSLVDLVIATIDNRRDPVSFGDVGGYQHRAKGSARGTELKFFGMGAWYDGDGQHQWLYDWGSKERVISLDTMKKDGGKDENPIQMQFGADRVFSVEAMYSGVYAVDIEAENPTRYLGVFPVMLDESSLRFSAMRSDNTRQIPTSGKRYFDKLAMRRNFDPQDEYLLLDGLSTLSHGHNDGNTITRLTWKDRIWLFDLDYIKMTPKYHNGVVVIRNSTQNPPPPLNVLDFAADFASFGFTRTTSEDYNGVDWERNIIWKKGRYFLFLDRIKAREEGNYSLESRWRTRGDVLLDRQELSVEQGDKSFYIKSADTAQRTVHIEPDESRSRWNYPYGDGLMSICRAKKDMMMTPGSEYTFANLMYAEAKKDILRYGLSRTDDKIYVAGDIENPEIIGFDAEALAEEGVYTDCSLFVKDARHIWLFDATYLKFRNAFIEAPSRIHIEINVRKRTGKLIIPEENIGKFSTQNINFKNLDVTGNTKKAFLELGSGVRSFAFDFTFKGDFWKNRVPFMSVLTSAHKILPEKSAGTIPDFGINVIKHVDADNTITSVSSDGAALLYGDSAGAISRFEGAGIKKVFESHSKRPILSLLAGDIDGDGTSEIISGDDKANVFCSDGTGRQLWTKQMTRYYGADANIRDIAIGNIDRSGTPAVLVANGGWKVYAFNPDGTVRWESFCYYHPLTKIGILDNGSNGIFIPVGTEYHTPINIVSPGDGKVKWKAWEEMGSEFISTTEYYGFHLTDMVFMDVDDDNDHEVVFGTKFNRIYAVEASDGKKNWEAAVDGEVTVMETFKSPTSGEKLLLAGTDRGGLFLYDRYGKRIRSTAFGSNITDIVVIVRPGFNRVDIVISFEDGRVIICDDEFLVRASRALGSNSILKIVPVGFEGDNYTFYAVTEDRISVLCYRAFYLKKSRHY
ncbi:hypothetical protein ACFL60_03940 [Candidatus Omnitrophota bacterium]